MARRLLITGGSGLLALNWACAMRENWDVVLGTHRHRVSLRGATVLPLNLGDADCLSRQLAELSPISSSHRRRADQR
ncbi:MAG: hypothetical protein M5U12_07625 [Verrucomicrobia bacterium]|nr:hypothetical protein [Verrucomicrobiota bacterium]